MGFLVLSKDALHEYISSAESFIRKSLHLSLEEFRSLAVEKTAFFCSIIKQFCMNSNQISNSYIKKIHG